MARPIITTKSNFFYTQNNFIDGNIERLLQRINPIVSYGYLVEFYHYLQRKYFDKTIDENQSLIEILEKKNNSKDIFNHLHNDKGELQNSKYISFLEYFIYLCSLNKDEVIYSHIDEVSQNQVQNIIQYYNDHISDEVMKKFWEMTDNREISVDFHNEVPLLIMGYSEYLIMLEMDSHCNKTKLCEYIEKYMLDNSVVNIRQEFDRIDNHFLLMENYVTRLIKRDLKEVRNFHFQIPNETKVLHLLQCYSLTL